MKPLKIPSYRPTATVMKSFKNDSEKGDRMDLVEEDFPKEKRLLFMIMGRWMKKQRSIQKRGCNIIASSKQRKSNVDLISAVCVKRQ